MIYCRLFLVNKFIDLSSRYLITFPFIIYLSTYDTSIFHLYITLFSMVQLMFIFIYYLSCLSIYFHFLFIYSSNSYFIYSVFIYYPFNLVDVKCTKWVFVFPQRGLNSLEQNCSAWLVR